MSLRPEVAIGRVWLASEVAVTEGGVPGGWWPWTKEKEKKKDKEDKSPLHDGKTLWIWARVLEESKFEVFIRGFKIGSHRTAAAFGNELLERMRSEEYAFEDVKVRWAPDCDAGLHNEIAITGKVPTLADATPEDVVHAMLGASPAEGDGPVIVKAMDHSWKLQAYSANSWFLSHAK